MQRVTASTRRENVNRTSRKQPLLAALTQLWEPKAQMRTDHT